MKINQMIDVFKDKLGQESCISIVAEGMHDGKPFTVSVAEDTSEPTHVKIRLSKKTALLLSKQLTSIARGLK